MHVCTHVHIHVYVRVYVHVYVHVYIHVHGDVYTHVHARVRSCRVGIRTTAHGGVYVVMRIVMHVVIGTFSPTPR